MANNLDEYGALDDKLQEILDLSSQESIPIFFEFNKRKLGQAIGKNIKIAVIGVQNAEGTHQQFKKIMHGLTKRTLFFTQGVGFGLKKNVSKGFTWHIESQSFGFNRSEDYATTLWAPLHPINTQQQAGGMRYVPLVFLAALE